MDWSAPRPPRSGMPSEEDFPVASETPHEGAWGIPTESTMDSLPLRMSDGQLQSMVLAVWREFMLHDEVLAAASFLRNAPYRVRHSAAVETALRMTVSTMDWMSTPMGSDSINTPSDPNGAYVTKEVADPLPQPLTGQVAGRYDWILSRLAPGASLVDFGCIDGTMTNRWALAGFKVTGVDMSLSSVRIAESKASEFKTGARHVCSFFRDAPSLLPRHSFDFVTCADTYEHMIDPVPDLLSPAKELLGSGRILLVTPHGSWFRGIFVPWGHPWMWYKEGHSWLAPRPRGHLVAPSVWSVAAHLREAGFWVKDCEVVLQTGGDVPGQGNVCAEAAASPPPVWPGRSFAFLDSAPGTPTESLARELASMGHTVRLYRPCPGHSEMIRDHVDYLDSSKGHLIRCDVLVTSEGVPSGSLARHASSPAPASQLLRLAAT